MSMLGWLITWSVQWMNVDSLSFLILKFSSLLIMLALSNWNSCFYSHECSAILVLSISPFVVFRLCSFTLVCKGLQVSPMYCFPHSHGMLYMQFFDSCVRFSGLVFVSMLRSVVHDLKAVLMPINCLSFLIFICLVHMVLSLFLWVSLALCDYQSSCVSLLVGIGMLVGFGNYERDR